MHWNQISPLHKNPNFFCWRMFFRSYKWMPWCVFSHFSHVWLLATLWTMALQAPLLMGFSRQEYWSGLPCPPPGDLADPRIEQDSPALQADSLPLSHCWNTKVDASQAHYYWCVSATRTSLQTELQNIDIHTHYIRMCVCMCVCVCISIGIYAIYIDMSVVIQKLYTFTVELFSYISLYWRQVLTTILLIPTLASWNSSVRRALDWKI